MGLKYEPLFDYFKGKALGAVKAVVGGGGGGWLRAVVV